MKTAILIASLLLNVVMIVFLGVVLSSSPSEINADKALTLWYWANKNSIENEYGYQIETPYVNGREVIVVKRVIEGGEFWNAGIREGFLVENESALSFMLKLDAAKKEVVTISFSAPGESSSIPVKIKMPVIPEMSNEIQNNEKNSKDF